MDLLEEGLKDAQAHYGRQHISIADAVNLFHKKKTQQEALPTLFLIKCLFDKYGKSLEVEIMDTCTSIQTASNLVGFSDKWFQKLTETFNALP